MARTRVKPVRRAFVFGGGGVLGFAWIVGALTALKLELGIEVARTDQLVGTSAGAVMSGLLASGLDIDTVRRHQLGLPLPADPPISWNYDSDSGGALPPRPGLLPGSPRLLWDGLRRPTSMSATVALSGILPRGRGRLDPIHAMIDSVVADAEPAARVADGIADPSGSWPTQPTWIVATNYATGRRVAFGRGTELRPSLADAVCASCAIPAWYAPVEIESVAYIDGGTRSNASVDLLDGSDYDEVYVLAPMAAVHPDSPRSPVAMVERRVRRSITRGIQSDIARLSADGARVVLLTPGPEDLTAMGANLMNPRRRTAVLHTALRTTAAALGGRTALADTGTA